MNNEHVIIFERGLPSRRWTMLMYEFVWRGNKCPNCGSDDEGLPLFP